MKSNDHIPLSEYPRMQLERDSYFCLNGLWDYVIDNKDDIPSTFLNKILVPYAPEAKLSGVGHTLLPNEFLIYRKIFALEKDFNRGRVFLHFQAVDQIAKVYLNGHLLGEHVGGFLPFSFEVQDYLEATNTLHVVVQDLSDTSYHSRGKQKLKRGGIWYSPHSGIYLPVWMESTPRDYLSALKITPHFDEKRVEIIVASPSSREVAITIEKRTTIGSANTSIIIDLPAMHPWSPDDPYLYRFMVKLGDDVVRSYFGMRKCAIEVGKDGKKRIFFNNAPLFQSGLLDQGYYRDGLLTPTSDKDYIDDIMFAKNLGFNVLRKHIKIESPRWYYHCDRLGMLVWQDFVNGGGPYHILTINLPLISRHHIKDSDYRRFGREDERGREEFIREAKATIEMLYNAPSIVLWTIFNEGWGQFDALKALSVLQECDKTRLFDHASGWHDQGGGAIKSEHVYFRRCTLGKDEAERARILSEFGGYQLRIEDHAFSRKNIGYHRCASVDELSASLDKLYEREIIPAFKNGLSACIYTQLSDVEDELNGLITYDRQVVKVRSNIIRKFNYKLTKGL